MSKMAIFNGAITYCLATLSICRVAAFYGAIMTVVANGTFWKGIICTQWTHNKNGEKNVGALYSTGEWTGLDLVKL